ncbi:hypothetical protein I5907_09390 [Panacibacter sp. DH6]|uniref:Uncharacterized protein n=1 Tax=Panacibacter microcysteis TaxID=2793269 RepID=A0A931E6N4_9BACT|nr:hypothetical protein [Panacibacter microcysteis]MBG9376446.1 hypothetical protein [Panacibacter microcysteis]
MKKLLLLALIACLGTAADAQFKNTKWKGSLQLENLVDVMFDFKTDTLEALVVADNSTLELMKYSVKDNVLSIQKISGQSDCAESAVAKYKFEMKNNELVLTVVEDECYNRSGVLNNTTWIKQ